MFETMIKEQFSFLLAQTPGDLFIKNRQGVYLACSESFAQKAGFASPADMIGLTDKECVWKESAATFMEHDQQVMEHGHREIFYESAKFSDGEISLLKTDKLPLRDHSGEIMGVMGVSVRLMDVNEAYKALFSKLQAKEALHQAEVNYLIDWYYFLSGEKCPETMTCQEIGKKIRHYLEYMINQVPMSISWIDKHGTLLGCNSQLKNMWNKGMVLDRPLTRHPYIGMPLAKILPASVADEVVANNSVALASDSTMIFEERVNFPEEKEKIYLSYKTPVFDDENQKIGLVMVSLDITDRKRMEEDLRDAKERAEAAHQAKIQFLKNMQHDVRTPLSCITGSVKILKKIEKDPEKLEFLDGVLYSGENLLKMLTKMLEYDHIQSNERPLQYQIFKLRVLLHDLVEMFTFATRQKGLNLKYDVTDDVPEDFVTDYYRFQRVLLNLVNNAIKFTHEGHIHIRISMDGSEKLCCHISDTGIGIEESKQGMIFQKYVRLVDANQGEYPGEGIGLNIVKQFVEELDGTIELESKLNEGSTFKVLLKMQSLPSNEVNGQEFDHEGVTG